MRIEQNNTKNQNIKNRLLLENSRVFFDFMQELSDICTNLVEPITDKWKYQGYKGRGSLAGREKKLGELIKLVNKLIVQGYDENGELLSQNSLSSFLKFYNEVFGDPRQEFNKIAEMLNYFNILRFLTEAEYKEKRHKDFDSLPYIFEDMCLSIRNMTDAISAYLVYKKEGEPSQLISRSGYVINNTNKDNEAFSIEDYEDKFSPLHIGALEYDLLIKTYNSYGDKSKEHFGNYYLSIVKSANKKIEEGITFIGLQQRYENILNKIYAHNFLLLDFPFREGETINKEEIDKNNIEKDERHFYVILELNGKELLIQNSIRILFLRNRLWEAVKKYYPSLTNFRFYCNYIRSVINKDNVMEDDVRILHLTDLHLDDNKSWTIGLTKLNTLVQKLNEFKNGIDLVAVTGDIVNASDNAAEAQRKYKRAANLLFEIAKGLWGKEYGDDIILPHDWKRRIIVTTGNHDYAAMNDVRVQTELRKITTGLPAAQSGGTMQKYTYFIEFLSYFLDAPTQKLLKYDLNEVREYDNLKLIAGIFNSCSKANALQNNKVSFNSEKIKLVIEDSNWKEKKYINYKHYIFVHHSPQYADSIDYFEDKYKWWELFEKGGEDDKNLKNEEKNDFLKLYWCFLCELGEYFKSKGLISQTEYNNFVKRRRVLEQKGEKEFKELWEDWDKTAVAQLFDGELIQNMKMFYNIIIKKYNLPDEYREKFITEARNLFVTMYNDAEQFKDVYEQLCQDIDNIIVCAGHVHKAKQFPRTEFCPLSFIGNQLYYKYRDKNGKYREAITFEIINNKNNTRDIHSFFDNFWWSEQTCEAHKERIKLYLKLE